MRISHLIIGLVVVGLIAVVVMVLGGFLVIREMDLFGFKTPEISQKKINQGLDQAVQTASGYTPAKSPTEAMELFREAIQKRKYKFAAQYCSKNYADVLVRSHDAANDLGTTIDRIRADAREKNWSTDRVEYLLYKLDPFPKNFTIKTAPVQKDETRAVGVFVWEPIPLKDLRVPADSRFQKLDAAMFGNVLALPIVAAGAKGIEISKEGEEWKLKVPTTPSWETMTAYYSEQSKKYREELNSLKIYMVNDRYAADTTDFENDILKAVTFAKK